MHRSECAGFTLIEFGIVLIVMGVLCAIGITNAVRYNDHMSLKGAVQNIAATMALTRERAVATRMPRTMKFAAATQGYDYRVEINGNTQAGWKLPQRVQYAWLGGTISSATYDPDGGCSTSGLIILKGPDGSRDTVCVLASGLVYTQ